MKYLLTYCFLFISAGVFAQLLPINNQYQRKLIERKIYLKESDIHTSSNSYYVADIKELFTEEDSLFINNWSNGLGYRLLSRNDNNKFVSLQPLINLSLGYDSENIKPNYNYNIGGGILLNIAIEDIFAISYNGFYNLLNPSNHLIINRNQMQALHGQGFLKGESGSYYNYYNDLSIAFRPYDFLSFETGFGSHFYGDGYRSLLISQNSYNYPYFKINTKFLAFDYSIVWAQFKHFDGNSTNLWNDLTSKYSVFHYLNWRVNKKLSIGLFEAITMSQQVRFDVNYLNPIIFFRPVEFYIGSSDNANLGANLKYSLSDNHIVYSQLVITDLVVSLLINDIKKQINPDFTGNYGWFANKWGLQFGYKTFDIFKIKNLSGFLEANIARPYTYSHARVEQNFSHFSQELAHPLGANFMEFVSGIDYLRKYIFISAKLMYAKVGMDLGAQHKGQNIFLPTMDANNGDYTVSSYYNTILQGNLTNIISTNINLDYTISAKNSLVFNSGLTLRSITPTVGEKTSQIFMYIGFKSQIGKNTNLF